MMVIIMMMIESTAAGGGEILSWRDESEMEGTHNLQSKTSRYLLHHRTAGGRKHATQYRQASRQAGSERESKHKHLDSTYRAFLLQQQQRLQRRRRKSTTIATLQQQHQTSYIIRHFSITLFVIVVIFIRCHRASLLLFAAIPLLLFSHRPLAVHRYNN